MTDSISILIERFHPDILYGFDPWPELKDGAHYMQNGTRVMLSNLAAWTEDGLCPYLKHPSPASSTTVMGGPLVRCFDFSRWLLDQPESIIVKMDIEGAEFPIIEKMISDGTDNRVSLLLVEFHDDPSSILERISCPVEEWQW